MLPTAMKYQQKVFGGQASWKMAIEKPKNMKHNCRKWNPNNNFASYKPYCKQKQGSFRTENKRRRSLIENSKSMLMEGNAVCTPPNTTSYIIRSKNCGGIPNSPASVDIITQANEEWGVNGYGSMKSDILRVRHYSEQNTGDFEPRLDKSVEILDEKVEKRLDEEDLSRFEMVYPSNIEIRQRILETRINGQDDQIAYLEDESTGLRERAQNMEQEIDRLKIRMRVLEGANAFRSTGIFSAQASFA